MLARPSAPLAAFVQKITGNFPWGIEKLTSDYYSFTNPKKIGEDRFGIFFGDNWSDRNR